MAKETQEWGSRIEASDCTSLRIHGKKQHSAMALCLLAEILWNKTCAVASGRYVCWKWFVEAFKSPESGPHPQGVRPEVVSATSIRSPIPFLLLFPLQVFSLQSIFQSVSSVLSGGSSATLFKIPFAVCWISQLVSKGAGARLGGTSSSGDQELPLTEPVTAPCQPAPWPGIKWASQKALDSLRSFHPKM